MLGAKSPTHLFLSPRRRHSVAAPSPALRAPSPLKGEGRHLQRVRKDDEAYGSLLASLERSPLP